MNITKFMQRLDKPFEPITTLVIIYFALLAVSIALYALIQIFFKADTATASSLLSWSGTMFATIALLFTFYNWRKQKESEVIANYAKQIIDLIHDLDKDIRDYICDIARDIGREARQIENNKKHLQLIKFTYASLDKNFNVFLKIDAFEASDAINDFQQKYLKLQLCIHASEFFFDEMFIDKLDLNYSEYSKSSGQLLDYLYKFALYKN